MVESRLILERCPPPGDGGHIYYTTGLEVVGAGGSPLPASAFLLLRPSYPTMGSQGRQGLLLLLPSIKADRNSSSSSCSQSQVHQLGPLAW